MMNHKITIQAPPVGKDAAGQIVGDWTDLAPNIWADIMWQTGAEAIRGGLPVSTVRISAMIRARADVTNAMRLVHKGVRYDVKAILPAKDPRFMFLACEAAR